ncbi:hypothetical protein EMCRGX_G001438 [Ephydatia muelleri]
MVEPVDIWGHYFCAGAYYTRCWIIPSHTVDAHTHTYIHTHTHTHTYTHTHIHTHTHTHTYTYMHTHTHTHNHMLLASALHLKAQSFHSNQSSVFTDHQLTMCYDLCTNTIITHT